MDNNNFQMPVENPGNTGNKKVLVSILVGVIVLGALLSWWFLSDSGPQPSPSVSPVATPVTDENINELQQLNDNTDLNAEFQNIDQDLNSL